MPASRERSASARGSAQAFLVAAGIFLSRIAGLVRERVFAFFLGNSAAADAFRAAFRIPNLLQNLFGEGSLSASFIPVYARLRAEGRENDARRVAAGVASVLGLVVAVAVLLGVLGAPLLVTAIAPGFTGEKRALTIELVAIFFPGAGLLVCSAWCLGVLNSHRRFFLSYAAPVVWNAVIIGALLAFGRREVSPTTPDRLLPTDVDLAVIAAWGAVIGSAAQFLVQLPLALRLARPSGRGLQWSLPEVRQVVRNFVPVFVSRGVIQVSAFVDELLCSWLPTGAFAAFGYAATLYQLPFALFGMAVAASELPEMSSAQGGQDEVHRALRERLDRGLGRMMFFVLPSAVCFLALGDLVVAAIYQTGRFGPDDVTYVWAILASAALGLPAATAGRLYASAFYALQDTRTPLRFACVHVAIAAGAGALLSLWLPGLIGFPERWGVVGLSLATALAVWVELFLLRARLGRRIGHTGLSLAWLAKVLGAAFVSAAAAFGLARGLSPAWHPILKASLVLPLFGGLLLAFALVLRVEEAHSLAGLVLRQRRRSGA